MDANQFSDPNSYQQNLSDGNAISACDGTGNGQNADGQENFDDKYERWPFVFL